MKGMKKVVDKKIIISYTIHTQKDSLTCDNANILEEHRDKIQELAEKSIYRDISKGFFRGKDFFMLKEDSDEEFELEGFDEYSDEITYSIKWSTKEIKKTR